MLVRRRRRLGEGGGGRFLASLIFSRTWKSENKVEKVESASLFMSTVEEDERKGNKSRDPKTKMRKGHLLFYSILKGVNGSITCRGASLVGHERE